MIFTSKTRESIQLAAAYTLADELFNPTLEDNYSTVNLAPEACGVTLAIFDTEGGNETISHGFITRDCLGTLSKTEKMCYVSRYATREVGFRG